MVVDENLVTIMPITSAIAVKEINVNKCLKVKLDLEIIVYAHLAVKSFQNIPKINKMTDKIIAVS